MTFVCLLCVNVICVTLSCVDILVCVCLCVHVWTLGWQCVVSNLRVCMCVHPCVCVCMCLYVRAYMCVHSVLVYHHLLSAHVLSVLWADEWPPPPSPLQSQFHSPPAHEGTPTLRRRHGPHPTTFPPPYIGHAHFILIVPFHVDTKSSHFLHSLSASRDHDTFVHCVMFPVNAHCMSWLY